MTLTVEDGTGVVGADSYVDVAAFLAYASKRGYDYSSLTTAAIEAKLTVAMDYIESKRAQYRGYKTSNDQALQFPRSSLYIDGVLFDSDAIPDELKNAQMQLAIEAQEGADLMPTRLPSDTGRLIEDTLVGVTIEKYDVSLPPIDSPVFAKVNAFLKPLLKSTGRVIRA